MYPKYLLATAMDPIKRAVQLVGGSAAAGKICGVTARAVNKWISAKRMPRTEYTGETNHAEKLARASSGQFTAHELLSAVSRKSTADVSNCGVFSDSASALKGHGNASSVQAGAA